MRTALTACLALLLSAPASLAQNGIARAQGFLDDASIRTLAGSVPPAPLNGSPQAQTDIAASERLRALEDSDRWLLATRHADLRPAIAISDFDCVLDARLTAENSPGLTALLDRILIDANGAAEIAKAVSLRPRPIAVDPARRPCQVVSEGGRASASYPSGSAAVGAAYGEAFALLAPDRAEAAREMGRQIGLSRLVCAMHYPSDVEAGAALGRAVLKAESGAAGFQEAVAAARVDLDRARASGETSPACAAERAALSIPLP